MGRSTISDLDLAWFNSLSSKGLCIFAVHGGVYFFKHSLLYVLVNDLVLRLAFDLVHCFFAMR